MLQKLITVIEFTIAPSQNSNQIRILNSITGKNHIAIEYSHGVFQEHGEWEKTNNYLATFSFTDGKLSLIKELW